MKKDNSDFSLMELRDMLLSGKLEHEYLSEKDYSALIASEMELPEPLNEVIDFYIDGLDKYEEYRELEKINIDIKALIKQVDNELRVEKRRKLKIIPTIAAAMIIMIILTQSVSMAFGFDFLAYIFKWDKEILEIETPINKSDGEEPIYTVFEKTEDLPEEVKAYIPLFIWEHYQFNNFSQLIHGYNTSLTFFFKNNKDDNVNLTIDITKTFDKMIEKDNDYFDEYEKGSIVFNVFKNLEYYKVVWVDGDLLYHINVNLPLEEVKEIADSFYGFE